MLGIPTFTRSTRLAVLALALSTTSACAHNTASTSNQPTATIRVENQSFYDYNIFVSAERGTGTRLGFVRAKSTKVFTLPEHVLLGEQRSLQFQARPMGSQGGPVSEDVLVSPGDEVGLQIPPS